MMIHFLRQYRNLLHEYLCLIEIDEMKGFRDGISIFYYFPFIVLGEQIVEGDGSLLRG